MENETPNRHGEKNIRHDSYQDAEFKSDYDPTFEDENGMKHPYEHGGPENTWSEDIRSEASKEKSVEAPMNINIDKRRLKIVDKFENDDYSRFAAPDYEEHNEEDDEEEEGVSEFVGRGPKDYKRSDDRIYEDACDALMQSRLVDASHITVVVKDGHISLSGKVTTRKMKKDAEIVVEHLPGVWDVRNELSIIQDEAILKGPLEATKKDLGI